MARIEAHDGERYPFVFVGFEDERDEHGVYLFSGLSEFHPNITLTDEEAADLRRVRDEFEAWQDKLMRMLGRWEQP